MLRIIYPEFDWKPWRFKRLPSLKGSDPRLISEILDYIETEGKFSKPEDWYGVSITKLQELGLISILAKGGGLVESLKRYRKYFNWDEEKFVGVRHFGKKTLGSFLKKLWPLENILEDYSIGSNFRVSFFVATLKLGFDYQEAKDYGFGNPRGSITLRVFIDAEKVRVAESQGLTLIPIPFWWDRTLGSLLATIIEKKPRLRDSLKERMALVGDPKPIPNETIVRLSNWK